MKFGMDIGLTELPFRFDGGDNYRIVVARHVKYCITN